MSPGSVNRDWIRFVLEADGISDYREVPAHQHRVDWIARFISFISLAAIGFAMIAVYSGLTASRPSVSAEREQLLARVRTAQSLNRDAELLYATARDAFQKTQDAVRPDLNGELARNLDVQSLAAGVTKLRGSGLAVVLDNSERPTYSGSTDLGQVIDRDVQHVVNALWQSGAEAITVNGIRLTSRTSIRNAGSNILVGYKHVTTPITVKALGQAATLKIKLKATSEWDELGLLRDRYGIRWTVRAQTNVLMAGGSSVLPGFAQIGDGS